jgi:hypothetical protein
VTQFNRADLQILEVVTPRDLLNLRRLLRLVDLDPPLAYFGLQTRRARPYLVSHAGECARQGSPLDNLYADEVGLAERFVWWRVEAEFDAVAFGAVAGR